MQVWHDLGQAAEAFAAGVGQDGHTSSVVTIGNFDGVHRGHQAVLGRVVGLARADGRAAVAVTFDPHPAQVHRPADAPALLTGLADKLDLLARTGLDAVLVVPYTLDLADLTPDEFVTRYLVEALRARTIVVGHDVRFGKGNSGTLATMVELGGQHGFEVVAVDDVGVSRLRTPGGSARWSSSAGRLLLAEGDVAGAAAILGRPHRLRGVVVHGDARGRQLGFPTANLGRISGMVPADGVYAGRLLRPTLPPDHPDRVLPAAVSVGTNPTFDGVDRRVEAYVLDRDDLDLYDEEVVVELVDRLRPTLRFDGVDALVRQMHDDVDRARELLR
ncbi:bifunctional riboflavin kinase/FAD synthetase [Xylanimicrobium sp. FW10M-9]|uniref:Riboflavin biosynthesis protein n=1 Tax=Xylanimonas protaetiae TaxID=2509457 RepID=A0A4P6F5D3_9MICO|nr:bifunctional riboflavin kinase/FAD synthetase [Xylanimonas protaetiae]